MTLLSGSAPRYSEVKIKWFGFCASRLLEAHLRYMRATGQHQPEMRGLSRTSASVAPDSTAPSRLLDVEGVAEFLGVTVRHVRRLVAERRIPFLKWGHYVRFEPEEIACWIQDARVNPSGVAVGSDRNHSNLH